MKFATLSRLLVAILVGRFGSRPSLSPLTNLVIPAHSCVFVSGSEAFRLQHIRQIPISLLLPSPLDATDLLRHICSLRTSYNMYHSPAPADRSEEDSQKHRKRISRACDSCYKRKVGLAL